MNYLIYQLHDDRESMFVFLLYGFVLDSSVVPRGARQYGID